MNDERWRYTSNYIRDTFGQQDEHLEGLMAEATARGMPDIAVSADVGRLLLLLTSLTAGRLAIEVGTLAGYSSIWIARGLGRGGRLITIEPQAEYADFAEQQFVQAAVADRVELRRGYGIEVLERLATELPAGSVDLVFLDAIKAEYPDYFRIARPLIAPGGLLLADNVIGAGDWWIDQENVDARNGADRLNRTLATDPGFEAVAVPLREGLLIARRTG